MRQNKNHKISTSLKKYHHKKRTRIQRHAELKVIVWILLAIGLIGFYTQHRVIKPVEAQAPYARMSATLPILKDKSTSTMTVKDRIILEAQKNCNKKGLGQKCVNDLLGMANRETKFNNLAVGDNGSSYGLFQIHRGYHPEITVEQARDIEFSTNWTLNRLVAYGYPEFRSNAIMRHNGTPGTKKTLAYLASVNSY